jgi:tetratricopeptide (TPR) repeat protein
VRRVQIALICAALLYPVSAQACYVNVYGESLVAVEAEVAKTNAKIRLKPSQMAQVMDLIARAKKGTKEPSKDDLGLLHYRRGVAYLAKYKHAPGVADIDEAIKLKPDLAEAYFARAGANRFSNQDKERVKRVLADYDKAIELKPDYYEAYHLRGTFKDWQRDYPGALADYK